MSSLSRQLQQTAKVTRTGHEIALWCYHADKYWCEAAFFLRRVIFTLVTVLLIREKAAMIITWFCILILVFHARFPVFRKQSSSYFHDFCPSSERDTGNVRNCELWLSYSLYLDCGCSLLSPSVGLGAIVFQSALNLDIYAADPTGYVDFSSVTKRAQVVIVYGVTLLPILIGLGLFIKEFFKERIRKRHAVMKKPAKGGEAPGDELEADLAEDDSDEEDELDTFGSALDGSGNARTTNENSASSGGRRPHSPSIAGVAGDLAMGVLAQGPNVSTRVYNNAPIDLDAVLSSLTGAVISTPQFPNNHHPPVTITLLDVLS